MSGLGILEIVAEIFCFVLLARIAVRDFQTLKVSNRSNLLLLLTYVVWLVSRQFEAFETDLLVGALFSAIALLMWLAKALGAGDVKLYFVLGLLLGIETAVLYVVLLLIVSFVVLLVVKLAKFEFEAQEDVSFRGRLARFQQTGKLPYAVLMVFSAVAPLWVRFFSLT